MTRSAKTSHPSSAQLFQESHAAPPAGVHVANIDGASRGNPGPAAYAIVLRGPDGVQIAEVSKCIGRETNNVAEYYALIAALDYATAHSIEALRVRSDSELLVRQMQGRYRVKSEELKPLHERAQKLARGLRYFALEHVPREQNSEADALANLALDSSRISLSPKKSQSSMTLHPGHNLTPHPKSKRIRARFRGGVFIPDEIADLPEDSVVELSVHPIRNR